MANLSKKWLKRDSKEANVDIAAITQREIGAFPLFERAVRVDMSRKFGGDKAGEDWIDDKIIEVGLGTRKFDHEKLIKKVIRTLWFTSSDAELKRFHDTSRKLREGVWRRFGVDSVNPANCKRAGSAVSDSRKNRDKTGYVTIKPSKAFLRAGAAERKARDKVDNTQRRCEEEAPRKRLPRPPFLSNKDTPQPAAKGKIKTLLKTPPSASVLSKKKSSPMMITESRWFAKSARRPKGSSVAIIRPEKRTRTSSSSRKGRSEGEPATDTACIGHDRSPRGTRVETAGARVTSSKASSNNVARGVSGYRSKGGVHDFKRTKTTTGGPASSTGSSSTCSAELLQSEGEEEMQFEDGGVVVSQVGIGASAAELASIDLKHGVNCEWIEVEWQTHKTPQGGEYWMQWFEASVDLRKPVRFDERNRPWWAVTYSRFGSVKSEKSTATFLTKNKLLDDLDSTPRNWRKKKC